MKVFQKWLVIIFIILSKLIFGQLDVLEPLPSRYSPNKKIIEFGTSILSVQEVKDNIGLLSQRPFDGIVFKSKWPEYDINFPQSIFYPYRVTEDYMELDKLSNIEWSSNLTDNFLRFWVVGPNRAEWFDDSEWEMVLSNLKLISKATTSAKIKGIFLDTEHYKSSIWEYNRTLYPLYNLEEVQNKVRERGKQFIEALQMYSPDIKVLCAGGWIFTMWEAKELDNIENSSYCLLKSFCDGMLEGAVGNTKIIDGNEIGYYLKYTINWQYPPVFYNKVSENPFIASDLINKSKKNMQVGHGLFYKYYKPIEEKENQQRLEHHIYQELLSSDEYVWFYNEEKRPFSLSSLPLGVESAILSAKEKITKGKEPGFTTNSNTVIFSDDLKIISPKNNQIFHVGDTVTFSVKPSPDIKYIHYYLNYQRQQISYSPPAIYKAKVSSPGKYLVYATSNVFQKMSNPVTYYVKERSPSSVAFITTWKVDETDEKITIPTYPNENYNYTVQWEGVDNPLNKGEIMSTGDTPIVFPEAGRYRVIINGKFPRIYFNNSGDKDKILTVEQWGGIKWKSQENAYYGCKNLMISATDSPNLSQVTSLENMFKDAYSINQDLSDWNVSNIITMEGMFENAHSFNQNLESWDMSNVSNINNMFKNSNMSANKVGRTLLGWRNSLNNLYSLQSIGEHLRYCHNDQIIDINNLIAPTQYCGEVGTIYLERTNTGNNRSRLAGVLKNKAFEWLEEDFKINNTNPETPQEEGEFKYVNTLNNKFNFNGVVLTIGNLFMAKNKDLKGFNSLDDNAVSPLANVKFLFKTKNNENDDFFFTKVKRFISEHSPNDIGIITYDIEEDAFFESIKVKNNKPSSVGEIKWVSISN
ncbi:DUF285 domain-containing protein [Weeksellaceae bacterium TAE3-ERU29]|nr:DUF285 domain-containing protein [Weeksellaceae bacterium TAE3-ERU29]